MARIRDQRRAHGLARAREQMQYVPGHARIMKQLHGPGGDARGLFRRLGQHRIARRQRAHDLAGENRQRKVPRADADKDAAPLQQQMIALARRPRQALRCGKILLRLHGVIAAKIHRLAHLRHAIVKGLAGLIGHQRNQARRGIFQRIGTGPQDCRAGFAAKFVPCGLGLPGGCKGGVNVCLCGVFWGRERRLAGQCRAGLLQALHFARLRQVDAGGIAPLWAIKPGRRGDGGIARQPFQAGKGVGRHLVHRHALIKEGMHEGGVGTVFQQAAHQIGQQILMAADRRINAAGQGGAVMLRRGGIERIAHAVQALKLDRYARLRRQMMHRGQGMGVVGGKLPVNQLRL